MSTNDVMTDSETDAETYTVTVDPVYHLPEGGRT
jgi:hypothetical protein